MATSATFKIWRTHPRLREDASAGQAGGDGTYQAFTTPVWLMPEDILRRIEHAGAVDRLRQAQAARLNQLLDPGRLQRLIEQEAFDPGGAYRLVDLFDDLRRGLWSELDRGGIIEVYRRNLQRAHVERLEYLLTQEPPAPPAQSGGTRTAVDVSQSDMRALARAQLDPGVP